MVAEFGHVVVPHCRPRDSDMQNEPRDSNRMTTRHSDRLNPR